MTDHVIPLNERHLKRLANEYLTYYHEDRTHKSLGKQTPTRPANESRPQQQDPEILALPRIGCRPHRYCWKERPDGNIAESICRVVVGRA